MRAIRWAMLATLLVVTLGACGCPVTKVRQAAARTKRSNTLKVIGLAYMNYFDSTAKAPTQAADLQKYTGGDPDANAALTDGSFTFIYGVTPAEMSKQKGASQTVVGYDTQFDKDNVIVLMGDASVQYVSAEEFKKMPQAAPATK
jgi:hypothetical protein